MEAVRGRNHEHAMRGEPVAVCDPHREDVEGSDRHGDQAELVRRRITAYG